jgi:glycosyltransferase involved in cell wall biosynthesis
MNPLVSIIVLTYNSGKYIIETLDSTFNQSYQNIELIVSDDCSTDNTVALTNAWLETHKERFRKTEVITVPVNAGIPKNCNRGLKSSSGEWIKFLSGDDVLHNSCIEKFVQFALGDPAKNNFFFCNRLNFAESVQRPGELIQIKKLIHMDPSKQLVKYACERSLIAPFSFCRHDTILALGGFDESYRYLEDFPFYFKALENGYHFVPLDENLIFYRVSGGSISGAQMSPATKQFYKELDGFVNNTVIPYLKKMGLFVNALSLTMEYNPQNKFPGKDRMAKLVRAFAGIERKLRYSI